MEITKFLDTQKALNNCVIIDETLSEYKIFARKHVELHIKMSELAEETKCYTYWIDGENNFDKVPTFEKYISCLRQIISLILDNNHETINEIKVEPSEYCISDQFLNLYIDVNDLIMSPSKDHFITLLEDYFSIGLSLGFTEKMITESFCNNVKDVKVAL